MIPLAYLYRVRNALLELEDRRLRTARAQRSLCDAPGSRGCEQLQLNSLEITARSLGMDIEAGRCAGWVRGQPVPDRCMVPPGELRSYASSLGLGPTFVLSPWASMLGVCGDSFEYSDAAAECVLELARSGDVRSRLAVLDRLWQLGLRA